MIVVDTSVWIFVLRNADREIVAKLQFETVQSRVLVGDIVLIEMHCGACNDRCLRGHGIPIMALADATIVVYCIENHHQLLYDARDFLSMAEHLGLQIT